MKLLTAKNVTYLIVAVGIGMYVAALVDRIDRLNFYLFCVVAFNMLPYAFCLMLLRTAKRPITALCSAILLLIVDLWLFKDIIAFEGFSVRKFAYSSIVTMYAPLWKMALVVPAGFLVGLAIHKRLR